VKNESKGQRDRDIGPLRTRREVDLENLFATVGSCGTLKDGDAGCGIRAMC